MKGLLCLRRCSRGHSGAGAFFLSWGVFNHIVFMGLLAYCSWTKVNAGLTWLQLRVAAFCYGAPPVPKNQWTGPIQIKQSYFFLPGIWN